MSTVHRLIPRRDPTFAEAPKKARPMPKRRPAEVHIDRARLARGVGDLEGQLHQPAALLEGQPDHVVR